MSRSEQKLQTRQRVIDAANYLFAEQGLARTRTADIARRAGLSHGGMFVHFSSRDELLAEVVADIGRRITDRLHAAISDNADLEEVLRAHLQCLSECEPSYATFLRESRHLPEATLRSRIGVQSAISFHLNESAERAMQAGQIRRMPKHMLFNTWIGLVHHYLMNRELFAPNSSVLRERGEELVTHFLSLLSTPEDSK